MTPSSDRVSTGTLVHREGHELRRRRRRRRRAPARWCATGRRPPPRAADGQVSFIAQGAGTQTVIGHAGRGHPQRRPRRLRLRGRPVGLQPAGPAGAAPRAARRPSATRWRPAAASRSRASAGAPCAVRGISGVAGPDRSDVAKVEVSLARRVGTQCRFRTRSGSLTAPRACTARLYVKAKSSGGNWALPLRQAARAGRLARLGPRDGRGGERRARSASPASTAARSRSGRRADEGGAPFPGARRSPPSPCWPPRPTRARRRPTARRPRAPRAGWRPTPPGAPAGQQADAIVALRAAGRSRAAPRGRGLPRSPRPPRPTPPPRAGPRRSRWPPSRRAGTRPRSAASTTCGASPTATPPAATARRPGTRRCRSWRCAPPAGRRRRRRCGRRSPPAGPAGGASTSPRAAATRWTPPRSCWRRCRRPASGAPTRGWRRPSGGCWPSATARAASASAGGGAPTDANSTAGAIRALRATGRTPAGVAAGGVALPAGPGRLGPLHAGQRGQPPAGDQRRAVAFAGRWLPVR